MSVELGTNAIGRDGGWHWESDRAIRALKPGNAGRAKRPGFRRAVEEAAEGDIRESLFKPHADPKVSEAALSPGEAVAATTAWTRGPSSNGTKSWCFPGIMSFLCVTALASWMLPTPRLVVLGGESGNRFGPRTLIARERPEVSMA